MKSIKILLIVATLLQFSFLVKSQEISLTKKTNSILKDTLWLKLNMWKDANCFKNFSINESEALETDFFSIPIYIFNKSVKNYNYGIDFKTVISYDISRIGGFIIHKGKIVGFLKGYQREGKWNILPLEIFTEQSPLKRALYQLDSLKVSMSNVYSVFPLGSIFFDQNDITYRYDFFCKKFIPIDDYIKERVTLETFRNHFYNFSGVKRDSCKAKIIVGNPIINNSDSIK